MTIYAGRIRAEFGRHVKTAFFASRIWIFAGRIRRKQMNQDSAGGIPAESGFCRQNPGRIRQTLAETIWQGKVWVPIAKDRG